MYNHLRPLTYITSLLLILQLSAFFAVHGASNSSSSWKTLAGDAPLVIAQGGFSGLFPDSSAIAYQLANDSSLPNVVMWCDVQLTKDGAGICFPYVNLDNSSTIGYFFEDRKKSYRINGNLITGWFSVDFTLAELMSVSLTQGIYSRSPKFDSRFPILAVLDMVTSIKPSGLWLNIEHNLFFVQHNLSMRSYVLNISKSVIVDYISSPEVTFLSSIVAPFKASKTKLIFRFLGQADTEPSTNQTYGVLLKNLTYIKTFASGIIVPKNYIWPVDQQLYLLPHTSLVSDAHKVGLEVFASEFANDVSIAYNYSYDPIAEYVSFIDNGDFSVDGLLSGFPVTPSEAIGCFSHIGKNNSEQAKPLVISFNGASGDYPGCTDLSYMHAISDGADVIDCPVQMTKDGIPICLSSMNLIDSTNVVQSPFSNLTDTIPELNGITGIFTFRLTWSQIQTLTPIISTPYQKYRLYRNPKFRNAGNFVSLSDFLTLAKSLSSGVLINIENAAYLAEKGFGVIDAVTEALSNASYPSTKKVLIQSTNSSVLMKFRGNNTYEIVYAVDEYISGALNSSVEDIKTFADSVVVRKGSVYPDNQAFLIGSTDTVAKFKSFNLPVYVQLFSNEFVSQSWDYFSDPTVEINSFVQGAGIDGVVTDFPRTAATYKKNLCLGLGNKTPVYMTPVLPGLMSFISPTSLPPAEAPHPVLTEADVNEPPLPSVESVTPPGAATPPASSPNAQPKIMSRLSLSILAMLLATLWLF